MGVARSVPGFVPAGGHRNLYPAPAPGDADLPGDQGQGTDDQEPLEGGLPQLEHQIHTDRHRRADRAGSGLVQRSVLGVVLSAAGFQGGRADLGLHRGSCIAHCNAELDLFWLAVGPDRPQAGDLGRHMLLAAITYYPLYLWLGTVTQPGNINYPIAIFLVCYVGMVYGPVAASSIRRAGD